MAASWYSRRRKPANRLATTDAQPKTTISNSRYQPSWCQLRAQMELSDMLQVAWVDTIGFYVEEEEEELEPSNSAAPINFQVSVTVSQPKPFNRPVGTLINAQVIDLNRTIPVMPLPAPKPTAANDLPMLRLEQLSLYRLPVAR